MKQRLRRGLYLNLGANVSACKFAATARSYTVQTYIWNLNM